MRPEPEAARPRWTHRDGPGWENESKCAGTRIVRCGRTEFMVRCETDHAHRVIECVDPSGRVNTYDIRADHEHGDRLIPSLAGALATEPELRQRQKRAGEPYLPEPAAIQPLTPPEVLDDLAREAAAGRIGLADIQRVIASYREQAASPALLAAPPPAVEPPALADVYPDDGIPF